MSKLCSCESASAEVKLKPLKGRKSEPMHIKYILPGVMRDIRNRMKRQRSKK